MKKTILFIITMFAFNLFTNAQNVNIPDSHFKAYLIGNISINTNFDTEIQESEAIAFNGAISCPGEGITDFTGIEFFVNITELICYANNLTSLDISQNISLTYLHCGSNNITSLDVSQNSLLTKLWCQDNNLTTLNVSQNTALEELNCYTNNLTSLNVSQNSNLENLNCEQNNLNALDVSQNPLLSALNCQNNSLTVLNMKNISTTILTGTLYNQLYAASNSLTCIDVDDVAASNSSWTNIDAGVSFSLNCQVDLVTSITVQGQGGNSSINNLGGTLQMEASVLPTYADDDTYTWSVTNGTGSASISTSGLLTASTVGNVTVTATANDGSGITGDKIITISNPNVLVNSITIQGEAGVSTISSPNGTLQMEANVLPANADDATYTWSVTNGTGTASIDGNGLLTAISDGTVTVKASSNDNSGITGDIDINISNQNSVGIKENKLAKNAFQLYPNPSTSQVIISNFNTTISNITIIELTGKVVQSFTPKADLIDLSMLNNGIYIVKIQVGEQVTIQKMIKQQSK